MGKWPSQRVVSKTLARMCCRDYASAFQEQGVLAPSHFVTQQSFVGRSRFVTAGGFVMLLDAVPKIASVVGGYVACDIFSA